MIRVFIIDDHPMVVEGVKALLAGSSVLQITGSAQDAYAALQQLQNQSVDVVLLDINLPDFNGIDLCKNLKLRFPSLKILGLSTFQERSYITRMMDAGASGYLLKNATRSELEQAVETAFKGRKYLSPELTVMLEAIHVDQQALPLLTSREKEVLHYIAAGFTNQQIAEKLFISSSTVDSHRKNLLAKFGVKNTAAMVRFALEYKLI